MLPWLKWSPSCRLELKSAVIWRLSQGQRHCVKAAFDPNSAIGTGLLAIGGYSRPMQTGRILVAIASGAKSRSGKRGKDWAAFWLTQLQPHLGSPFAHSKIVF